MGPEFQSSAEVHADCLDSVRESIKAKVTLAPANKRPDHTRQLANKRHGKARQRHDTARHDRDNLKAVRGQDKDKANQDKTRQGQTRQD